MNKFLILSLLIFSTSVNAKVLVLVHGYLGSVASWENSGINHLLEQNGWKRGGIFQGSIYGPRLLTHRDSSSENKAYVVDLPSESPIIYQSGLLTKMLDTIRQHHSGEDIIIVGHSAGGVVARMSLVTGGSEQITGLITIAGAHLGTTRAEQALDITRDHGPFNIVKNIFGGNGYDTLRRSRGVLVDLTRPRPGSLLFWLNNQKHPDIRYVSIVRSSPVGSTGDNLVPGFSQDMNNVPALKDRSDTIFVPSHHELNGNDGIALIDLLKSF